MKNLLKADLFRIIKSKITIISLIVAIVAPLLIVLMYFGIDRMVNVMTEGDVSMEDEMLMGYSLFNVRTFFNSSYSISNNLGFVLPIFSAIFVSQDVLNGSLRNKVIAGEKRRDVYLSHLLSSMIFNFVIITIFAMFTILFGLMFFKWGVEFDANELKNFIFIFINGSMTYLFLATLTTFLGLTFNSPAPTILITVGVCVVLGLVVSVISIINYESYKYLVYLIPTFISGSLLYPNIDNWMFIEGILSLVLFGGVNTVLGMTLFKKKDLK